MLDTDFLFNGKHYKQVDGVAMGSHMGPVLANNEHFSTCVFRKQTYTGLASNFYSSCFYSLKLNSILTLLHRAFSLSSDRLSFHNEIEFLRKYFQNNCYPKLLFEKYLKKLLNNKLQQKIPVATVPKLDCYVSLPFTNDEKFLTTLRQILKKYFYCLRPKLVLRNPRTIGSLFRFKDTVPNLMRSLVVCKHTCPGCNLGTYVGSTKRMLKVRVDSHRGVSHRTGCTLSKKEFSNIREHSKQCKARISYDDFEVLEQAPDETSLHILESLTIKQLVPSLNSQSSSAPLFIA